MTFIEKIKHQERAVLLTGEIHLAYYDADDQVVIEIHRRFDPELDDWINYVEVWNDKDLQVVRAEWTPLHGVRLNDGLPVEKAFELVLAARNGNVLETLDRLKLFE